MTGENTRDTSREAYHNDALPTLSELQKAVYDCLVVHPGGMTNLEVAYSLRRAINTITPRMNELVKMGRVHDVGRGPCRQSGRTAIVWDVRDNGTLF